MLTQNQLPLNTLVSFDLYPEQFLGSRVTDARVIAVVDASVAQLWIDTHRTHLAVYPTLPPGVPNSHDAYPYVRLKLANGNFAVYGLPWIKENTLRVSDSRRVQLTLNNMTQDDYDRLVQAVSASGWNIADIRWIS